MTHYLLMLSLGLILFLGARFTGRTVARREPELIMIQPAIPKICFGAQVAGMMISVAAFGAAICVALT